MAFQIGDKYYHEDPESGQIAEISKSTYEQLNSFRLALQKTISPELKGKIQIISTSADDFTHCDNYSSLWKEWGVQE